MHARSREGSGGQDKRTEVPMPQIDFLLYFIEHPHAPFELWSQSPLTVKPPSWKKSYFLRPFWKWDSLRISLKYDPQLQVLFYDIEYTEVKIRSHRDLGERTIMKKEYHVFFFSHHLCFGAANEARSSAFGHVTLSRFMWLEEEIRYANMDHQRLL